MLQELEDIRKSGMRNFRDIQVDDTNILSWQGLIVPVSHNLSYFFLLCMDVKQQNIFTYTNAIIIFFRIILHSTKELFV